MYVEANLKRFFLPSCIGTRAFMPQHTETLTPVPWLLSSPCVAEPDGNDPAVDACSDSDDGFLNLLLMTGRRRRRAESQDMLKDVASSSIHALIFDLYGEVISHSINVFTRVLESPYESLDLIL